MNIKQELEELMQKQNITIEEIAPLISTQHKRLQKDLNKTIFDIQMYKKFWIF